jgi:RNA polymerase sigma-70 factor (ECF subfamily)
MGDRDIDQTLVERVQRGDKSAFDILVRKYQHKVIKVISRYIRDHSEAQDVSQDAFIKAYRALPRFRGDSAFYTWMYRIAINTAKNHLVTRGRRLPSVDIDAQEAEQFDGDSALKEYATPERLLQRDEIQRVVFDTIDQLPDDLKTAITLREIDGLSYEEIAETMECPVGTVRSRIFRAREAIDKTLRPLLGDEF